MNTDNFLEKRTLGWSLLVVGYYFKGVHSLPLSLGYLLMIVSEFNHPAGLGQRSIFGLPFRFCSEMVLLLGYMWIALTHIQDTPIALLALGYGLEHLPRRDMKQTAF